jgi:hypothetical protein
MSDRPDTYNASQVIQRSEEAQRLLDHPLLAEAFEAVDADFVEEWRVATNPEKREAAWYKIQALNAVQDHLQGVVSKGEIERIQRAREGGRDLL